jgi:predicted metalloprotease
MSFNEGANLDTSQVTGGGSRGGLAIGGGIGGLVIVLIGAFLGVDLTSLGGTGGNAFDTSQVQPGGDTSTTSFDQCKTGADANRDDTCRIIGTVNSVQDYWADALPADVSRQYRAAKTVIYSGQTQSPCGTASNQTGPFYCPSDERVYVDASFFKELTSTYGADGGALAQEYVIAHEYGHHVENILGLLEKGQQDRSTGPRSGGVRIELAADCMAGVWANHASTTQDDHIQEELGGGNVNQDTWTHGSSESRQKWFLAGYRAGTVNACDTFSTNDL